MGNAKEVLFTSPLPLLLPSVNGLELNEETANILGRIHEPVVVVAIAGKYRTGKSYILNLLSNLPRNAGFELGSTVQSKTKGIWVYGLPHPSLENTTLLLLDTEGLGDVDKGDQQYDTALLLITILLSSTFILNVVGRLDDDVINQLGLVSALTKSMKNNKNDGMMGEDLETFFPKLFVLLRDFSLDLIVNGKEITANEYFNDFCLKNEESGTNESCNSRNLIRKHFPKRFCFTLPFPVFSKELLRKLETVPDEKLNPEFLEESQEFVKNVLDVSTTKKVSKDASINGDVLVNLLRQYLKNIRSGSVSSVQTSLQATAEMENNKLLEEFVSKYNKSMRESLTFPTSYQNLLELHQRLFSEFSQNIKVKIIFDFDKSRTENRFKDEIEKLFKVITSENEEKSRQSCLDRLNQLSSTLSEKLNRNAYCKRGGHAEYISDFQTVIATYNNVVEKGVKHDEVLHDFIKDKEAEGTRILAIEQQLIEAEQKAEAARREKELAEERARLEREMAERAQREAEEQRRIQEEQQRQLQQQLEERRRQEAELQRQVDEQRRRQEAESQRQVDLQRTVEELIQDMKNRGECICL